MHDEHSKTSDPAVGYIALLAELEALKRRVAELESESKRIRDAGLLTTNLPTTIWNGPPKAPKGIYD